MYSEFLVSSWKKIWPEVEVPAPIWTTTFYFLRSLWCRLLPGVVGWGLRMDGALKKFHESRKFFRQILQIICTAKILFELLFKILCKLLWLRATFFKKKFSSWKLETHCTSVFFYADHDPAKIKPLTSLPFELLAKSTKVTNYYTQYNERAYCIPERHYKSGLRNTLLTATLLTPDSTQQDSDGSVTSTIPIEEVKYFPPPMRNIQWTLLTPPPF